jgi:hypothetical protein
VWFRCPATHHGLASKRQDCRQGSFVTVQFQDLVEMQNQMRETLDRGLEDLQSNQGKSGLPVLSAAAAAPPVQSPIAAELPPMDQNVSDELRQGSQQADQTLRAVASQTPAPGHDFPRPVRRSSGSEPGSASDGCRPRQEEKNLCVQRGRRADFFRLSIAPPLTTPDNLLIMVK